MEDVFKEVTLRFVSFIALLGKQQFGNLINQLTDYASPKIFVHHPFCHLKTARPVSPPAQRALS